MILVKLFLESTQTRLSETGAGLLRGLSVWTSSTAVSLGIPQSSVGELPPELIGGARLQGTEGKQCR